jgi:hypothetical protein
VSDVIFPLSIRVHWRSFAVRDLFAVKNIKAEFMIDLLKTFFVGFAAILTLPALGQLKSNNVSPNGNFQILQERATSNIWLADQSGKYIQLLDNSPYFESFWNPEGTAVLVLGEVMRGTRINGAWQTGHDTWKSSWIKDVPDKIDRLIKLEKRPYIWKEVVEVEKWDGNTAHLKLTVYTAHKHYSYEFTATLENIDVFQTNPSHIEVKNGGSGD